MEKDYFCEEEFHLAPIPLWLSVAIQIALLLLTAYFSMLEVVAESLNESRLERLKDEGSEQAERLLPLLRGLPPHKRKVWLRLLRTKQTGSVP